MNCQADICIAILAELRYRTTLAGLKLVRGAAKRGAQIGAIRFARHADQPALNPSSLGSICHSVT